MSALLIVSAVAVAIMGALNWVLGRELSKLAAEMTAWSREMREPANTPHIIIQCPASKFEARK